MSRFVQSPSLGRRLAGAIFALAPLTFTAVTLTGCDDDRGGVTEEEAPPPADERSFGGGDPTQN